MAQSTEKVKSKKRHLVMQLEEKIEVVALNDSIVKYCKKSIDLDTAHMTKVPVFALKELMVISGQVPKDTLPSDTTTVKKTMIAPPGKEKD